MHSPKVYGFMNCLCLKKVLDFDYIGSKQGVFFNLAWLLQGDYFRINIDKFVVLC